MQNYQQRMMGQSQQISPLNAPNASIATMGPETFKTVLFSKGI